MTDTDNLTALHQRLLEEQRSLILAAAEQGCLPSAGALARIADLENAIVAAEATIDERK